MPAPNFRRQGTVSERVLAIVQEYTGVTEVKPEHRFGDWRAHETGSKEQGPDLGEDSLDRVEIVMALEDEFELEIEDDVATTWKTVADAISHCENAVGDGKASA